MDAKRRKHDGGVSSLPEDMIFDVLARLPTKALCRFKCVCKRWSALISDPAFIAAQRPCAATDPHLVGVFFEPLCMPEVRVIDMDGNVVSAFEITKVTPQPPPQLLTRLDLICSDGDRLRQHDGMVVDPAARQAFAAFGLRDPTLLRIDHSISIGRATPSGICKVLRVQNRSLGDGGGGHEQLCDVATFRTLDSSTGDGVAEPLIWRRKTAPPFVISRIFSHKAIVNGVVYFLHELVDSDEDDDDDAALKWNRIVAFDLESEEWKAGTINGPPLGYENDGEIWGVYSLVELKGTLGLVHDYLVNKYLYTDIWLLVDPDKNVWVKEYTRIPIPMKHMRPTRPLGVLVDGRILLLSSMWENEETWQNSTSCPRLRNVVLFYDPITKAFTDFIEIAEGFRHTLVFYTGSLLS